MHDSQASQGVAWWCGWGGLALVAVIGAAAGASDGGARGAVGGVLMMTGVFVFIVAVIALVRGRVWWAMLRSRGVALLGAVAAFAMLGVGGAVGGTRAEAGSQPTGGSTNAAAAAVAASSSTATSTSASASTTSKARPSSTSRSPAPKSTSAAVAPAAEKKHVAKAGTALAAVKGLTVKGRAAKTGYSREAFGQEWFDADRNGCDTRNDVLRRDLTDRSMKNYCKVLAGTLAKDPYTGSSIRFVYGGPSETDIDHVVALGDAWQKGAADWPFSKRLALANDPANLLAVDAGANRSKGDGDAATWLPPNKAYRCTYVARQITLKKKYGLWVTPAERDAMVRVLSNCDGTALPPQGTASTSAQPPRTHTAAPTTTTTAPPPPKATAPAPVVQPPAAVYYANCTAVHAAGAAPIYRGDPGYSRKLDRDGDGVACE